MSASTHRDQAESLLRFLEQKVGQFETFHVANYRHAINGFCDWFVRDDVNGIVANALYQRVPTDVLAWCERAQRESKLPELPQDPAAVFAFRWMTLRILRREKLDLRYFISILFSGNYLNEKLMRWKRLIVHPFAEDCRRLSKAVIERLPADGWVDLDALVGEVLDGPFKEIGFGPRPWTSDDDDEPAAEEAAATPSAESAPEAAPAPAATPAPTADAVTRALDALEAAVQTAALPTRADQLIDVRALRLERERGAFLAARFRARLADLARHAPLAAACEEVTRSL